MTSQTFYLIQGICNQIVIGYKGFVTKFNFYLPPNKLTEYF